MQTIVKSAVERTFAPPLIDDSDDDDTLAGIGPKSNPVSSQRYK